MSKRFWVSWIEKGTDFRPVTFPPRLPILGWWCSGYDGDDNAIICAAVEAESHAAAESGIRQDWPGAGLEGWRFFGEQRPNWTPGDRFPLEDWMKERFGVQAATNPERPEPNVIVYVEGGQAAWTGSEWVSKEPESMDRPIMWSVNWWAYRDTMKEAFEVLNRFVSEWEATWTDPDEVDHEWTEMYRSAKRLVHRS